MKLFKQLREGFYQTLYSRQKGIFYRGEPKKGGRSGVGFGAMGNGIYLTWEEDMANAYADYAGKGAVVNTYKIKKGLKIAELMSQDVIDVKAKLGFGPTEYSDDKFFNNAFTFELKRLKYDGVVSTDGAEGIVIYDKKNVKLVK
jgi:hypothetical protein